MIDDTAYYACTFLNVNNIIKCSLLNKQFNKISKYEQIWKSFLINSNFNDFQYDTSFLSTHKKRYILTKFALKYKINVDNVKKFRVLYLTSTPISSLPEEMEMFFDLKHLSVFRCDLQIPLNIHKFINLQILSWPENNLLTIPSSIGLLINLQELVLDRNKLNNIPSEIGHLTELRQLKLSYNKLKTIPSEIKSLDKLYELQLNNNKLISIPTEIGQLLKLEYLDLSCNKLESIPIEMAKLPGLLQIDLSGNTNYLPFPVKKERLVNYFYF